MEEMSKHGQIGQAAMKADMDRKTARKYVAAGKLPSELKQPRYWRTRPDPFEEHWAEIEARLQETPEFEAKTLFELLQQQYPGRYEDGQLRTLQRHVKRWAGRRPRWVERRRPQTPGQGAPSTCAAAQTRAGPRGPRPSWNETARSHASATSRSGSPARHRGWRAARPLRRGCVIARSRPRS